jgi:hypothetical protein
VTRDSKDVEKAGNTAHFYTVALTPKNALNNKYVDGRGRGTTISWTYNRDGKRMRKKRGEKIKIETRVRDFPLSIKRVIC